MRLEFISDLEAYCLLFEYMKEVGHSRRNGSFILAADLARKMNFDQKAFDAKVRRGEKLFFTASDATIDAAIQRLNGLFT